MAMTIGKRKRSVPPEDVADGSEDEDAMRARFQKAFEKKFKPLEVSKVPAKEIDEESEDSEDFESDDDLEVNEEDDEDDEECDWSGLSDDENHVEVVDYNATKRSTEDEDTQRREKKAFMVAAADTIHRGFD